MQVAEDWDLWLRAISLGAFSRYPWTGVEYRKHGGSAIKTKTLLAEEMYAKALARAFAAHPELGESLKRKAQAHALSQSMVRFLAAGDKKEARARALRCLSEAPAMPDAWFGLFLTLFPDSLLRAAIKTRKQFLKWLT